MDSLGFQKRARKARGMGKGLKLKLCGIIFGTGLSIEKFLQQWHFFA